MRAARPLRLVAPRTRAAARRAAPPDCVVRAPHHARPAARGGGGGGRPEPLAAARLGLQRQWLAGSGTRSARPPARPTLGPQHLVCLPRAAAADTAVRAAAAARQSALCSSQAARWQSALQYRTVARPEHIGRLPPPAPSLAPQAAHACAGRALLAAGAASSKAGGAPAGTPSMWARAYCVRSCHIWLRAGLEQLLRAGGWGRGRSGGGQGFGVAAQRRRGCCVCCGWQCRRARHPPRRPPPRPPQAPSREPRAHLS
jgi:hypothetical protein